MHHSSFTAHRPHTSNGCTALREGPKGFTGQSGFRSVRAQCTRRHRFPCCLLFGNNVSVSVSLPMLFIILQQCFCISTTSRVIYHSVPFCNTVFVSAPLPLLFTVLQQCFCISALDLAGLEHRGSLTPQQPAVACGSQLPPGTGLTVSGCRSVIMSVLWPAPGSWMTRGWLFLLGVQLYGPQHTLRSNMFAKQWFNFPVFWCDTGRW